jgi:hypothetical protein
MNGGDTNSFYYVSIRYDGQSLTFLPELFIYTLSPLIRGHTLNLKINSMFDLGFTYLLTSKRPRSGIDLFLSI